MAEIGGPTMSLGPQVHGHPVPDKMCEVNYVLEQTKQLKGKPDMSSERVKNQAVLLRDEIISNGSVQVQSNLRLRSLCGLGAT
jgi:hypothetical protein